VRALIRKLYELRRETVMREARSHISGEFLPPRPSSGSPSSLAVDARAAASSLQVYGCWDMVATFVHHGALSASLVYDTCQEMYFQHAKIQPYLAEFRKAMNLVEWMILLERFIKGSKLGGRVRAKVGGRVERALGEARCARTAFLTDGGKLTATKYSAGTGSLLPTRQRHGVDEASRLLGRVRPDRASAAQAKQGTRCCSGKRRTRVELATCFLGLRYA
jgi:hypothetical protein